MSQPPHSSYAGNSHHGPGSRPFHGSGSFGNYSQAPRPGFGVVPHTDRGPRPDIPTEPRAHNSYRPPGFHPHQRYGPPHHFNNFQHSHYSQHPQTPSHQYNAQLQETQKPALAAVRINQPSNNNNPAWSSNADPYLSAMYDTDGSSGIRKTRGPQGTNRQGGQSEDSKGIRGRKFGYALIGKEKEQYVTEDLREQLASAIPPIAGDPSAPSPLTSTRLAPQAIVDEFKEMGHLDIIRKELLSHFQSTEQKDRLLHSLQEYLLQRIKDMTPEARQKMASQNERLQQNELNRWFEESAEVAVMVDGVLERLRGEAGDESSLFASQGVIGSTLESRLSEVIQSQKARVESHKADTSDEEGDSTPLNKGSVASGGSQTPMTTAFEMN